LPTLIFAVVVSLVFLAADAFVIPFVMRPLFDAALGASMLEELRLFPAALFYLIQIAGVVWFAGLAFLSDGRQARAGLNGAILGFVAYSCYEMTSWTIMRDWHIGLVVTDIVWGTVISGLSAYAGAIAVSKMQRAKSGYC
jgi:uncharacterized membrane protein